MEASKREIFKLRMKLGKLQKEYSSIVKYWSEAMNEKNNLKLEVSGLRAELNQTYNKLILVNEALFKAQDNNFELRTGLPVHSKIREECILRIVR